MRIRTLLIAALVFLSMPAGADFKPLAKAHEVALSDFRLPGTVGGTISFKPCVTCSYETARVSSETLYEANGRRFTLEEFRQELAKVVDPSSVWLTVMQDLESNTITAVQAVL